MTPDQTAGVFEVNQRAAARRTIFPQMLSRNWIERHGILIAADVSLATGGAVWIVALGAALWGFQMGATQGLLSASIADAAPFHIRGTAFGIYDLMMGVATFFLSFSAGLLWTFAGPEATFAASAFIAAAAALVLFLRPLPSNSPA